MTFNTEFVEFVGVHKNVPPAGDPVAVKVKFPPEQINASFAFPDVSFKLIETVGVDVVILTELVEEPEQTPLL